jgi:uncharacterized membrane protein YfcA
VLVIVLGLSMTTAIGTSLVIVAVNSTAGFAAHASDAPIDVPITVGFTAAAVVAALGAGRFGAYLDTGRLKRWFAWLVFAVAALVLVQVGISAASS